MSMECHNCYQRNIYKKSMVTNPKGRRPASDSIFLVTVLNFAILKLAYFVQNILTHTFFKLPDTDYFGA